MALLAGVVVLALGACTRGDGRGTDPTIPTRPVVTSAADPYAIPGVIDAAYVNRVLAALNQIDGDFIRLLVQTRTLGPGARTLVRAIYNDPEFDVEVRSLETLDFSLAKQPPGNRKSSVTEVVTASASCILAKVRSDYSAVVVTPEDQPGKVEVVTLRPKQAGADPQSLNPTPWAYAHLGLIGVDEAPPDRARCDA